MSSSRAVHHFVSPVKEVDASIWTLFAGATTFLGFRIWCKVTRRHGLWYDDYILLICWLVLLATNVVITTEMATGYVTKTWGDRMLILISISSCGTTIGQTWSKTAFAVTLLRMTDNWKRLVVLKVFMNWSQYCDEPADQNYWRMQGFCLNYEAVSRTKAAGNIWNIIMDFVLALFPWMVIWKLKISQWEKIGLCGTMSLGVVVAVISAIRQAWMDNPASTQYDDLYFWHQGLSMVWYSAEVTGTIMVQCIPVMRPMLGDMKTSLASRRFADAEHGRSATAEMKRRESTRARATTTADVDTTSEEFILEELQSAARRKSRMMSQASLSPSEVDRAIVASRTQPLEWPLSGNEAPVIGPPRLDEKRHVLR
ncbi:hypothetical protein SCAR479_11580 [Seiridium cardinale]|uniref:Rhodopsin domain-containing protein n=1 Tax=Seiridium cardinale TaxID=138064 RepID=A0ABR2XDF2_9PEZI